MILLFGESFGVRNQGEHNILRLPCYLLEHTKLHNFINQKLAQAQERDFVNRCTNNSKNNKRLSFFNF